MQINVMLDLELPRGEGYVGVINKPVLSKKAAVDLTPELLEQIVRREVKLWGFSWEREWTSYFAAPNSLVGRARMNNLDKGYIADLIRQGFVIQDDGVRFHPGQAANFLVARLVDEPGLSK